MKPQSTARIGNHPIHPMLVPFPIACFVGTLAVDIVYSQTGDAFWAVASGWLLIAGLVMAALAALAGLTDFLSERRIRRFAAAWSHMIGKVIVMLIELFNLWQRIELGGAFIVPPGLTLSAGATVLFIFTGWMGWQKVSRPWVGRLEEG